jgi:hypothetical protein
VSEQLDGWLSGILESKPENRPQSGREARRELEIILLELLGPLWRWNSSVIDEPVQSTYPRPKPSGSPRPSVTVLLDTVRALEALVVFAERDPDGGADEYMYDDGLARIGHLIDDLVPGDTRDAALRARDALRAHWASSSRSAALTVRMEQLEAARARVDEFVTAARSVTEDGAAAEGRERLVERVGNEAKDLLRLARLWRERAVLPDPVAQWYVGSCRQWLSADIVALGLLTPPETVAAGRKALEVADDLWELVLVGAPPDEREQEFGRVEAAVQRFEDLLPR